MNSEKSQSSWSLNKIKGGVKEKHLLQTENNSDNTFLNNKSHSCWSLNKIIGSKEIVKEGKTTNIRDIHKRHLLWVGSSKKYVLLHM